MPSFPSNSSDSQPHVSDIELVTTRDGGPAEPAAETVEPAAETVESAAETVDPAVGLVEKLVRAIDTEGRIEEVKHLLNECDNNAVDISRQRDPESDLSVFGRAIVSKSDPELFDILFARREFDVNLLERPGQCEGPVSLLYLAAFAGNMEAVQRLCSFENVDLTFGLADDHCTVLHMCVRGRNPKVMKHILEKAKETLLPKKFAKFLNGEDQLGMTALHHAAWEGCTDIAANLLHYDAAIKVNASAASGFTALHLASWKNRREIVRRLLKHRRINPLIGSEKLSLLTGIQKSGPGLTLHAFSYPEPQTVTQLEPPDSDGSSHGSTISIETKRGPAKNYPFSNPTVHNADATALHCAVLAGHLDTVEILVKRLSSEARLRKVLNAGDDHSMTPLHCAVLQGDASIVEELLTSPAVRGTSQEKRQNLMPLDLASILLTEAKSYQEDQEYKSIISMLLQRKDVKAFVQRMSSDRDVFVQVANAVLIGAALIAGISFACWLQPPFGFQDQVEPDGYNYAALRHVSVQVFWVFNTLSFCFAIATILTGAGAVLPSPAIVGWAEVQHIRILLIRALLVLSFSVFFVLGAFLAAGFACLPPPLSYKWVMSAPSVLGGLMCVVVLCYYYKRVFRLFQFPNVPRDFTAEDQGRYVGGFTKQVWHAWHVLMDHHSHKYPTRMMHIV